MAFKTAAEAAAILESLEKEKKLFSIRVDGIAVWQLFRFNASLALQDINVTPHSVNRLAGMGNLFRWFLRDCLTLLPGRQAYYFFVNAHSVQVAFPQGKYGDKHFAQLLSQMEKSVYVTSSPREPAVYPTQNPPAFSFSIPLLYAMSMKRLRRASPPIRQAATQLREALSEIDELSHFDERFLCTVIDGFFLERKCWLWILKRFGDPFVVVADTGSYSLASAAAIRGTRIAELQHGLVGPTHPCLIPVEVTPSPDGLICRDALILNGKHWLDLLENRQWHSVRSMVAAGSPWLEMFRNISEARQDRPENMVLCTLQGIESQKFLEFVRSALDIAGESTIAIVIKLHPLRPHERELAEDVFRGYQNITILAGDEGPSTHELLTQASLHLSISSATHYDALAIGTPTCIIPLATHDAINDLIDSGLAMLASNPTMLAQAFGTKQERLTPEFREKFCSPGALDALCRELRNIYKNSPCRRVD